MVCGSAARVIGQRAAGEWTRCFVFSSKSHGLDRGGASAFTAMPRPRLTCRSHTTRLPSAVLRQHT